MLLDIMLNGRFICQLNYKRKSYYAKSNGKLVEVHSDSEIAHFVETMRPSLKGKNYNVCFTNIQNLVIMKSIKEFSKEWCSEHSNKGCKEQCDGCWQIKSAWGCEQHNMELACEAGANYVLEEVEKELKRRMFEDYNQREEEDEVAQGCMASMIAFVKQLKK